VRQIQESRKDAQYNVDDRIKISISWINNVLSSFKDYIQNETLSTIVDNLENPDLEKDIEIEELNVKIKLKK
jgi:hypothetical protein